MSISDYNHAYYLRNKDKILAKNRAWNKKHRKEYLSKNKEKVREYNKRYNQNARKFLLTFYGGNPPKCKCCDEGTIEFLALDHINNDGAEHRRKFGNGRIYWWIKRNNFPSGFQVLCHNCNTAKGLYGICPHRNLDKS